MHQLFAGTTPIIALIAAILALGAFLFRAIRRKQAGRAISYLSELTDGVDLFLMSSLPRYPGDERWMAGLPAEAGQQVGQPLQILYGNLRWTLHPSPRFRLLITSPGAGEGTSFVAANLAVYMALSGAKVLLVDANRSQRVLHKWFRLDDGPGLADLAAEWRAKASPAEDEQDRLIMRYAQPTRVKNLHLLTGGYGSNDPEPDPFAGLPVEMVEQFDAVLLDAPSLSEAGSLWKLPFWHDVLLVGMIGRTRVQAVRHTVKRLEAAQIRTLGVVANCVPEEQMLWVGRTEEAALPPEMADAPPIPVAVVGARAATRVQQSSQAKDQGDALPSLPAWQEPTAIEDAQYVASVKALRDEVAHLNVLLAEQQAKSEVWAGRAQELEAQLALLLDEKAGEDSSIERIRTQVDQQQREIGRLKTVTAEYRQILAHKETLLQEYMAELSAAQGLIQMQRERLEFMQQAGNLAESASEKAKGSKQSGDISAD